VRGEREGGGGRGIKGAGANVTIAESAWPSRDGER